MFRIFKNHIKIISTRHFASPATAVKVKKSHGDLIISCKRTEFNLYSDNIINEKVKFGTIPLASSGWRHHKSKGDYFVLNPIVSEEESRQMFNMEIMKEFQFPNEIFSNLKNELEIDKLTEIQAAGIPKILDMNHVLIAAETGCGKTLSYLLPIVAQILKTKEKEHNRQMNSPLALIITPGRELASQVADVAAKLISGLNLNVKTILGGNTKKLIVDPEFSDVDILVGTMGAVSKLVTTGIYRMGQVRHVVLDEADTLLDDSFSDKLCYFLKRFPFHRNHLQDLSDKIIGTQLILASATMPTNIDELLSQIIDTQTIHEVLSPNLHRIMPHIRHKFLRMTKSDRPGQLLTLSKSELRKNHPLIIFGNKSVTSDFISLFLNDRGVNCVNLNGDMLMQARIGQFEKFQNGEVNVLSTTDVGSRGLDTRRAVHVVNFDFPLHISDYIHRCGRIGRVGSHHKCIITNFISSQREIDIVQKIEHAARTQGILPDVNANITNLIKKNIINELKSEGIEPL